MTAAVPMTRGKVLFDVASLALTASDRERLMHPATAGVVLFAENFESVQQLRDLIREIRQLRSPSLFIGVDQEGGRVQRFRDGFVRLPAARRYGELFDRDPQAGTRAAETGGWVMASELRAVGVDLSFAPVLDVASVQSDVIGDRAFHHEAAATAELATAFARGMRRAGMATVGKHFPGHGGVSADSHHELPVDPRPLKQIQQHDLVPYRAMIGAGLLDGVMTAHVQFTSVDDRISMFSEKWVQQILRTELGFGGVLFTDDLHMAGVADYTTPTERAQRALSVGCEVLCMCRDTRAADEMLDAVLAIDAKTQGTRPDATADRLSTLVQEHPAAHPADTAGQTWQLALTALEQVEARSASVVV